MDIELQKEKSLMSKTERFNQERFEQLIELVISYKSVHPKEDVYLSEKSIEKSIHWYMKSLGNLSKEKKKQLKQMLDKI